MLNTTKSILSKVSRQISESSTLEQLKNEIFLILSDERNIPKSRISSYVAYVLFSFEENKIVCKSQEDIYNKSYFFFDGSRKKDNFIHLATFDLNQLSCRDNKKIEKILDNWFKETFIVTSTEKLMELQDLILSAGNSISDSQKFIFVSDVTPPISLLEDCQLAKVFEDTITNNVFQLKSKDGQDLFSLKSMNRLFKIKDTLIKDTLDKFKEKQDYYSFESFLTSILRLRTLNYLTAGEFYSLMKTGFEINKNIWRDIDYFFKSNSLDFSRFKNESTLLINFEVNSKEDAKAIIELFNLAVKLFFSKNNEVYFSSDNYLSKMVKSIGETKWIPDDYDLGIGIPKSRLSMFVLRQRFAN